MYKPTPTKYKSLSQIIEAIEALDTWEPDYGDDDKQYKAVLDELYEAYKPFQKWVDSKNEEGSHV